MKEYIYKSLADFGNTIITDKTYKELGENNILSDLLEHGFDCIIEKRNCADNQFGLCEALQPKAQKAYRNKKDVIYVITDKRRFEDGKTSENVSH